MMVIGAHAARTADFPQYLIPYTDYLWSGGLGVRTFFVISGFLITWLLLREQVQTGRIDLSAFFKRRILRIFPVFYAFLFFVLALSFLIHRDFSAAEWLSAATFTRNYYYQGHWTTGHLWSISVEEQFYLIWPFVLTILTTRYRMVVAAIAVIIAVPCIRVLLHISPWRWVGEYAFFTHADSLMWGCLLAIMINSNFVDMMRIYLCRYRRLIQALGIIAIYIAWMLSLHGKLGMLTVPLNPTIQAFCIAMLIASVVLVEEGTLFRLLNLKIVAAVGVISYGLYIWQQIILYPAGYLDGDLWWRAFPQNIILVFLVASLSYFWIEKPFLNFKKRFSVLK